MIRAKGRTINRGHAMRLLEIDITEHHRKIKDDPFSPWIAKFTATGINIPKGATYEWLLQPHQNGSYLEGNVSKFVNRIIVATGNTAIIQYKPCSDFSIAVKVLYMGQSYTLEKRLSIQDNTPDAGVTLPSHHYQHDKIFCDHKLRPTDTFCMP